MGQQRALFLFPPWEWHAHERARRHCVLPVPSSGPRISATPPAGSSGTLTAGQVLTGSFWTGNSGPRSQASGSGCSLGTSFFGFPHSPYVPVMNTFL